MYVFSRMETPRSYIREPVTLSVIGVHGDLSSGKIIVVVSLYRLSSSGGEIHAAASALIANVLI